MAFDKDERIKAIENNWTDYDDGDLFVVNHISKIWLGGTAHSFCVNKVIVIIYYQGYFNICLNNYSFRVGEDDEIICYPGITISDFIPSENMKCIILGFSVRSMDNSFFATEQVWQRIFDVKDAPIIHLSEEEMTLLFHYAGIVKIKSPQQATPFQRRMMHALLQSLIYAFFDFFSKVSDKPLQPVNVHRRDQIYRKFIELLGKENGRICTVSYIARQLCITPKYLSTVIKASSGRSPIEWIHYHTINAIAQQLRYTNKSFKDISNELGFPNQHVFSKFVKTQLGMSSGAYRLRFQNEL